MVESIEATAHYDKIEATYHDGNAWTPNGSESSRSPSQGPSSVAAVDQPPFRPSPDKHSEHSPILYFVPRRGRLRLERSIILRNSLLPTIGFIELANAGDFAANVWKITPPPDYVVLLMVIGGTLALCVLYFVIRDAVLSWQNIRGLRSERRDLHRWRRNLDGDIEDNVPHKGLIRIIDCFLRVNFREMGTEIVDRFGMDTLMGSGALTVGIGTYMAIAGENLRIFKASDLMTGYIGNSPCALYGILNLLWSVFVWLRAQNHTARVNSAIQNSTIENSAVDNANEEAKLKERLRRRFEKRVFRVKVHSITNGITGIVAGAASLATYTHWQAYVILVPCLFSSLFVNWFWRIRVGYHRPYVRKSDVRELAAVDQDYFVKALLRADRHRLVLKDKGLSPGSLMQDPNNLPDLLHFMLRYGLYEDFCLRVASCHEFIDKLFSLGREKCVFKVDDLINIQDHELRKWLTEVAQKVLLEEGPTWFAYKERWLFEALGCYKAVVPGSNSGKSLEARDSWEVQSSLPDGSTSSGKHSGNLPLRDMPLRLISKEFVKKLPKSG